MVLEVFGGSGESSTDDDAQGSSVEPVAGGDSGIDLKKLLSSSSQSSGGPNINRQIMTHLRLLQANLQQLKVMLHHQHHSQKIHSDQNGSSLLYTIKQFSILGFQLTERSTC